MNRLIQRWLDAQELTADALAYEAQCLEDAWGAPMPSNLRPATADDLTRVGQVVWYPHWEDSQWALVEKPLTYGDPYKAYTAHDGSRYGLHRAFVEDEQRTEPKGGA